MPTLAQRFINAYNQIDYAIRVQLNFKRSLSFSDMIRRAVPLNYIVRKYEDVLIDYSRLRNAIVHKSNEEYIIAEPHEDVVVDIEKIAKIITTPPKAIDTVCNKNVLCALASDSIKDVIKLIHSSQYSNIPIYDGNTLIGIAIGQRILDDIGGAIENKEDIDHHIENTNIGSILNPKSTSKYYEVCPVIATVEEVLNLFFRNRKLLCVILTKNGTEKEPPIGIITSSDVLEMNTILENY